MGLETSSYGSLLGLRVSEVPLAHHVGLVARLPQHLWHGDHVRVQARHTAGIHGEGQSCVGGVSSGHQSRPARGAGRVHVMVVQYQPRPRQPVDVWRGDGGGLVRRGVVEVRPSNIINKDEYYVRCW